MVAIVLMSTIAGADHVVKTSHNSLHDDVAVLVSLN